MAKLVRGMLVSSFSLRNAENMEERIVIGDGATSSFLSSLFAFCVDSAASCFNHEPDARCVLVGLSSVSALLSLLSCLVLVCQRCRCLGQNPGETAVTFYCFLGNLCSTVGAILSRELYVQVLMGAFAAAMDAVSFMSCCLLVLLCRRSKAERRLRMVRRRRRRQLLALCILMVVAGGYLKPRVTLTDMPLGGRRLLHVTLQDNTEILGYILGLISFVIVCTSRLPAVRRVYRGQTLTQAYVLSGLLCSLAGALYTAAILLYDTQIGFLLRVMPWLLSAICCVNLDLLILVLHWCKRGTRPQLMIFTPDTESLLGDSGVSPEQKTVLKKHRKQKVNSSGESKTKKMQKMTEMGSYLDVNFHPLRKICLQEGTLSKEESVDRPRDRTMRVIPVDGLCFSDTSCDSSPVSSDLEWDFEEANSQWRKPTAKQQKGDEFPFQECPANPKPFNICTCAVSGLQKKTLSGKEEGEGTTAARFAK